MTTGSCSDDGIAAIALGTPPARPLQVTAIVADARGPYLRVTRNGVTRSFLPEGPSEIKYDVAVDEARDDIEPLDPVIIIRPARARV